jgi:hypothetical protein
MPSNVLVSGFEEPYTSFNGLYLYSGLYNDKPLYRLQGVNENDQEIKWISAFSVWFIVNDNSSEYAASSTEPLIPFIPPWESPNWYDVFFNPINITVSEALSDPITVRNNKYATATEAGAVRFRRLVSLGYI